MITDEFHGVEVADPERWLEDWSDPEVQAWNDAQNAATRAFLDELPAIDAVRERMTELMAGDSVSYRGIQCAGGRLFALKAQPPLQQPMIVMMVSADDPASERVLVDPNAIDERGTATIDFFRASRDGKLVAVSLSRGGTERGDVHVYATAGGRKLEDVVPGVNGGTAGGSLAWNGEGTGFFYTRYPRDGERPPADLDFYQQVYFHELGDRTENDRYEIGEDFPRIAEIRLQSSRDGSQILARVQEGDGGRFTHHLRLPDGSWVQLASYEDRCIFATLGGNGAVYLVSRKDAPRGKVLRIVPEAREGGVEQAELLIPEAEDSIDTLFSSGMALWPTKSRLFVLYQTGGPNVVKSFDLTGKALESLPSPPVSAINAIAPLDGDDLLLESQSYVTPPAWYHYRAAEGTSRPTKLVETSTADFSDCEAVREWAVSKDGTKVPITILRRKGVKLDGNSPALLTGYGGYGISLTPIFRPRIRLWVEQGGVYAVANTRGGGEFGEQWRRNGNLGRKQNVFDDFHAAARHLIDAGYTAPRRLAAQGGSNGGLLMGAMITQHPETFRAFVSFVGLYDMLRVELTPNGAFNVPEFGTVKDPEHFRALYAYSPYHRVVDGTNYPAMLMLTGQNDPRVDPWHSRKMTARLQAASVSGRPILLRTSSSSGHGIGTGLSELVAEHTDVNAFLLHELGMEYTPGGVVSLVPPRARPGTGRRRIRRRR